MVNKTIQDTSARRALTSSDVVGLLKAFLSKGLDVKLNESLPIAVAAAIGLDYATNVREAENAIEITLDSLHEYVDELLTDMERDDMVGADPFQQAQIEAEYAEQRQRFEAGLSVPQRSYVEESVLNGFVAMSWLGYVASMTVG